MDVHPGPPDCSETMNYELEYPGMGLLMVDGPPTNCDTVTWEHATGQFVHGSDFLRGLLEASGKGAIWIMMWRCDGGGVGYGQLSEEAIAARSAVNMHWSPSCSVIVSLQVPRKPHPGFCWCDLVLKETREGQKVPLDMGFDANDEKIELRGLPEGVYDVELDTCCDEIDKRFAGPVIITAETDEIVLR